MEELKVEDIDNTNKRIVINIGPEEVNKRVDKFLNEIKNSITVKGFRKGKAPFRLLKKQYSNYAKESLSNTITAEFYQKAIKEHNINPVSMPKIEGKHEKFPGKYDKDNGYSVNLTIEVLPKIDPQGYDDLDFKFPEVDIEKLYELELVKIQDEFAERQEITDGQAEDGDLVVIDFVGYLNGEKFDGGSSQDYTIDNLGGNTFVPGFEQQIVGMSPGEDKSFTVKFPENFSVPNLAGQDVSFDVKVKSIIRKNRAEVDTDLAIMAGFPTVDELKADIKSKVYKHVEEYNISQVFNDITEQLLEKNDFDVPHSLVVQESNRIKKENKVEQVDDELQQKIDEVARSNVKKAVILNAIYEKETDIEIDHQEFYDYLDQQAQASGHSRDDLVTYLNNTKQMDNFMNTLKERKVIKFLVNLNRKDDDEQEASSDGV